MSGTAAAIRNGARVELWAESFFGFECVLDENGEPVDLSHEWRHHRSRADHALACAQRLALPRIFNRHGQKEK